MSNRSKRVSHPAATDRTKTVGATFGALLRETRTEQGLSLREVAFRAGVSPTYLSLLERDGCGPPSDQKLQALANALGEPHSEIFYARAGRVHPRVVDIVLRHPSEWTAFIIHGKHLVPKIAKLSGKLRRGDATAIAKGAMDRPKWVTNTDHWLDVAICATRSQVKSEAFPEIIKFLLWRRQHGVCEVCDQPGLRRNVPVAQTPERSASSDALRNRFDSKRMTSQSGR